MSSLLDSEIYRTILESLPIGLCVVDLHKRILLWSDGAERITGRLRHEVVGHCCISEVLLHCNQKDCEWCHEDCPLARAMKTSHAAEANSSLRHQSGYDIPVYVRAVPVHNAHGSIIGAVETFEILHAAGDSADTSLVFPGPSDDPTGVAGPVVTTTFLRQTLANLSQAAGPCAVLCFRLDGLDHFRHACGPEAALALLCAVARTLQGALWTTDFIGRWSDDQFLAVLTNCSAASLPSVGERIRRTLAGIGIEWWGEKRSLPVSMGQASAQPGDDLAAVMDRLRQSLPTPSAAQAASAQAGTSGS